MQKLAKPAVFALAVTPAVWLVVRFLTDRLSVNPIEDITLTTGIWTLRFLVITIAITPLRRITGWNRLVQYRRMLGLFTFFYATLHVSTWIVLDLFFAWDLILNDIAKRPFITMGMIAFVAGVIFSSSRDASILKVPGSMSTNTGFAPVRQTAPAVAKNVKLGSSTSSP